MNKHKESSLFVNIAVVAGILSAVSAAIAVHPKGKQIKEHIVTVGDDFADAVEKTIDKLHGSQKDDEPLDVSDFVLTVFNELNNLNAAAEKDVTIKEDPQSAIGAKASTLVDNVEEFAHWFQKKGKALARKGF